MSAKPANPKAARNAKRRKRAAKAEAKHGAEILEAARKGGYTSAKPKKFRGKGGYSGLRSKLRGRGDFVDDVVGGGARLVGNGIRSGISWLTDKAGSLVSKLLGSGAYDALGSDAPGANGYALGAMPKMVGNRDQGFVVEFSEEIAALTASDVFKSTTFHLNPGLSDTFKWLPKLARCFEEYELEAMIAVYKPLITPLMDAAGGDMVLNVVYDANGVIPGSVDTALNSYLAVGGRPLDQIVMAVECAPRETPTKVKFVRAADPPDDADHNLYDWGVLCVSQQGQPNATVGTTVGRLYLSYKFVFYKPITEFNSLDTPTFHSYVTSANSTATAPFGATSDLLLNRTPNYELAWVSGTSIALPSYVQEGKWMVLFSWISTTASAITAPSLSGTGLTVLTLFANDVSQSGFAPTGGETASRCVKAAIFTVTGSAPVMTLSSFTMATGASLDVFVVPVDIDLARFHATRNNHLRFSKMRDKRFTEELKTFSALQENDRRELQELKDLVMRLQSAPDRSVVEDGSEHELRPPPCLRIEQVEEATEELVEVRTVRRVPSSMATAK